MATTLNDAGDLAIEDGAGDNVRILVLALLGGRAVVDQPNHAALEETLRLLADRVPVDTSDLAPLDDRFIGQQRPRMTS